MKRIILWMLLPFLRHAIVGRSIAILDETGATACEGKIISLVVEPGAPPRVLIAPSGGSVAEIRRYELSDIRFNTAAMRFEVESGNAVERPLRCGTDRTVGNRDNAPRDQQATWGASEHDQGEASDPQAQVQSVSRGADCPGQDSKPSDVRRRGAVIRLGQNPNIPPGVLIGVSPDQQLYVMHVSIYSGGLPDGSIIWGHPTTIACIRGDAPATALH